MPVNTPLQSKENDNATRPHKVPDPSAMSQESLSTMLMNQTRQHGTPSSQNILRLQRTIGNQAVGRLIANNIAAAPANFIQRGLVTAFDSNSDPKSKNVKLDENETLAARLIAQEIEKLLEQAQSNVDEGYSSTKSAAALGRDLGSRARGAKRGTAIHAETYEIIGDQLKGYGNIETKVKGVRTCTLFIKHHRAN